MLQARDMELENADSVMAHLMKVIGLKMLDTVMVFSRLLGKSVSCSKVSGPMMSSMARVG